MDKMEKLHSKTDFNEKSKYGLVRDAVMEHLDIAKFAIYRPPWTYEDLKRTVQNIAASREDLKTKGYAGRSVDRVVLDRLLMQAGTDRGQERFESKVDAITKQIA